MPLQPLSGYLLDRLNILPIGSFAPGDDRQPLLTAGGYPFSTMICYEDVMSYLSLKDMPEAAFLVNVTNDGWFGDTAEPHQHMQIARMRALETGRYLLRATNTGLTGVVAPSGKIIHQAPLFQETSITTQITPMQGVTPYAIIGDLFIILFLLFLFCFIIVRSRLRLKAAAQAKLNIS
jgi:apolipoprotein N-acyltransferase